MTTPELMGAYKAEMEQGYARLRKTSSEFLGRAMRSDDTGPSGLQHATHARRPPRRRHRGGGTPAGGGLIKYSRGHITVVDRAGLEARTCECYAVVKKESDRLLPNRIAS
jgi:uncharacterized protein (DUF2345 family)